MMIKEIFHYLFSIPKKNPDFLLLGIVLILGGIGVLTLYSASGQNFDAWAKPHLIKFVVGLLFMLLMMCIRFDLWYRASFLFYLVSLFLIVLVEFVGKVGMGAQRWIDLGFFQLQPSEIMKISLVLVLSHYYCNRPLTLIQSIRGQWLPGLLIGVPAGLVLLQPNLGNALMLCGVGLGMMILAGIRWSKLLLLVGMMLVSLPIGWNLLHDYQKERVLTFLNPERDPLGAGYNIIQSKIALGSGGIWGKGYLQGTQAQLDFLPEKQTDFILAVVAEEFGFVGCSIVLMLFVLMIGRIVWMALQLESSFSRYVLVGLALNIFLYVLINMGMVMGLMPVVGIPLPMLSYGGTVMIAVFIMMGIIQNIWMNRHHRMD